MLSHWVIWLFVSSGVAYASEDSCDPDVANVCFEDLIHYESIAFPFYGQNEKKLEETCGYIKVSYDCLQQFLDSCSEDGAECDDTCKNLYGLVDHFISNTGLNDLAGSLCNRTSALRETYLDNAECLYQNADLYASCHNDSQRSQQYISSPGATIEEKCCFFKWHGECFTNATREHCDESATFFVSFATHKLIGHIADRLCLQVESHCTSPPLQPEHDDETHTTDNEIDNSTVALDDKKKDQTDNDIDNEIVYEKETTTVGTSEAATIKSHATNWILLPFLYIILSKYIL